ncbi:superoxide dismutase [Cu-Zn] 2-like [Zerene cesonia]|uniref:superoxide dismutase [Cu-Zn] 2-like n=1 Tax=Zerene cesonia TaxID=33412 RepID=UPI0018E5543C|nr:superoxide dismutase [Cu-Zn] 2-like [Zerene cesonia]XP_038215809.1 superoxide dismutase [Cu-Zn] 2-like [Zerene cesonia]
MAIILLPVFAVLAAVSAQYDQAPLQAKVFLSDPFRKNDIHGNITFTQVDTNKVRVEGVIVGLPAGQYGFHVHEKGDITGGCLSTGPHFNPEHKDHGHPNDENRHVGDLGNIVFNENSVATLDFVDSGISLYGPHCILGRAVVLHEKADDFGRSDHPDSRKTGNAGGRVACGVIGIFEPVEGWFKSDATTVTASFITALASIVVLINTRNNI